MSLTVLLIALVPALAVVLIAGTTRSMVWTSLAALVAAGVGVLTGNPAYLVLDVLAVGVLYWLSMRTLHRAKAAAKPEPDLKQQRSPAATHPPKRAAGGEKWSAALGVAGVLGYAAYVAISAGLPSRSPPPIPASMARSADSLHPSSPLATGVPAAVGDRAPPVPLSPVRTAARTPSASEKKKRDTGKRLSIQECLQIKSEQRMQACMARAD